MNSFINHNGTPSTTTPPSGVSQITLPKTITYPPIIPPAYKGVKYNQEQITAIVYDIAAKPDRKLDDICKDHGTNSSAFWYFVACDPLVQGAYHSARSYRVAGLIEKKWKDGEDLAKTIQDIDLTSDTGALEIRQQEALVRLLRVQSLNAQYEASRRSAYYRDRQEVTHDIAAGAIRARAWEIYQSEQQHDEQQELPPPP